MFLPLLLALLNNDAPSATLVGLVDDFVDVSRAVRVCVRTCAYVCVCARVRARA